MEINKSLLFLLFVPILSFTSEFIRVEGISSEEEINQKFEGLNLSEAQAVQLKKIMDESQLAKNLAREEVDYCGALAKILFACSDYEARHAEDSFEGLDDLVLRTILDGTENDELLKEVKNLLK